MKVEEIVKVKGDFRPDVLLFQILDVSGPATKYKAHTDTDQPYINNNNNNMYAFRQSTISMKSLKIRLTSINVRVDIVM